MNPHKGNTRSKKDTLAFLASLSAATWNMRAAEGYVLDLLFIIAFAERDENEVYPQA